MLGVDMVLGVVPVVINEYIEEAFTSIAHLVFPVFFFLLALGQPSSSLASLLLVSPAAAGSVPSATSADVPAPLGLSQISDRSFPSHHMFDVSSLGSGQPLGCC